MSQETTVTGRWSIFGSGEEPHFGSLTLDEKGIKLKILHPVKRTRAEAMLASTKQRQVATTISGRDEEDHPVTLIHCLITREHLGQNHDEYEIVASVCIRGQDIESLDKAMAKYVSISLQWFNRWLGGKIMRPRTQPSDELTWDQPRGEKHEYRLAEGVSLTISQMTLHSSSLDELVFKSYCDIALVFQDARSLEEILHEWVPSVVRFFSLLYGNQFQWRSIGYAVENPFADRPDNASEQRRWPEQGRITTHTSLEKSAEDSEVFMPYMLTSFEKVKADLPKMLARWTELEQRLRPVVDLFWAVAFRSSLHTEASFLFLVQALEAYHARSGLFDSNQLPTEEHRRRVQAVTATAPTELKDWLQRRIQSSNYKPLNERVLEIFRRYSTESTDLFGDVDGTAKKITFTRNHLTHYSGGSESPLYLGYRQLMATSNGLERLLWIIFLKEIGLGEELLKSMGVSLKNLRGINID